MVCGALCAAVWAACGATNVVVRLEDDGRALLNPYMGWVMHYHDNNARYGTTLTPGDSMDWFPASNVVYLRLPWSWLEPEEGVFNWNVTISALTSQTKKSGVRRQAVFRATPLFAHLLEP